MSSSKSSLRIGKLRDADSVQNRLRELNIQVDRHVRLQKLTAETEFVSKYGSSEHLAVVKAKASALNVSWHGSKK